MPVRPRRPPVAGLRRLLLVVVVGGALALVAVYLVGRSRRPAPPPRAAGGSGATPGGEITLIGQGFEYTQTDKGRKVFRLRGDSLKVRQGNQVLLDGVGLTLYNEAGAPYEVASREATYDQQEQSALLTGEVVLKGPGGIEVATEGLRLGAGGKAVDSTGAVAFRYGQAYAGRADSLRANVPKDLLILGGNARVDSLPGTEPPLALTAQRLLFERDRHQVRADYEVELRRGSDVLRAGRLNVLLSADDRRVEFLRARWEVSGVLATGAGAAADGRAASTVTFRGEVLSAIMAQDGRSPRSVELEGTATAPLQLDSRSAGGPVDTLTAGYAVASFTGGELVRVEAFDQPQLTETAAGAPHQVLRRMRAERITASFAAGGRLAAVAADGSVDYRAADLAATGERLRYDAAGGRGEMFGAPVRASSARGELVAPRVAFEEKSRILRADGGVRATLAEAEAGGLAGSPLAAGEGPVRVEATEAFWRDQPRSVLFQGDVRAWQGKNLLLAAALHGDETAAGDALSATGGVKTVWTPAPPAGAAGATGEPADGPVEITAEEMDYDRQVGVLRYRRQVRVDQEGRALACSDLVVALDERGRATTMTCTGEVRLTDRVAGNTATGERAVYDLASRAVEIEGEPVRLTKADGARVEGRRVLYDLARGSARVLAEGSGG